MSTPKPIHECTPEEAVRWYRLRRFRLYELVSIILGPSPKHIDRVRTVDFIGGISDLCMEDFEDATLLPDPADELRADLDEALNLLAHANLRAPSTGELKDLQSRAEALLAKHAPQPQLPAWPDDVPDWVQAITESRTKPLMEPRQWMWDSVPHALPALQTWQHPDAFRAEIHPSQHVDFGDLPVEQRMIVRPG